MHGPKNGQNRNRSGTMKLTGGVLQCLCWSANKSHFQDLTSTVSLRSGGLLSENWNSQHCHCWPENLPASSTPKQRCTLMCHFVSQDLSKQIWNLKKWMVKNQILVHLLLKIAFFFSFQVYQKSRDRQKGGIQLPNFVVFMFPLGVLFFVSLKFPNR